MSFFLILDSDFNAAGPTVDIVDSDASIGPLRAKNSYDPSVKFTIPRAAPPPALVEKHPITNQMTGQSDPAAIYSG
jgi:hypothetical protein